jgi:hypothetical protein
MSAPRVACLIQLGAPLVYFANRLRERCDVQLVVVEVPPLVGVIAGRVRRMSMGDLVQSARNRVRTRIQHGQRVEEFDRWFGDRWRELDPDLTVMLTPSVNAPEVVERLRAGRFDVLVDHGTSIVKSDVLDTVPLALNLHWGLSPYYRGTACTEWALLNWDPHTIGVTIHRLARRIDGGDILAQRRAHIEPTDTVNSINMQLTALGTELMGDAIERLAAGEPLQFHAQDLSQGHLMQNRHWTRTLARQIEQIESEGLIGEMLRKPSRHGLAPIVEWGADPSASGRPAIPSVPAVSEDTTQAPPAARAAGGA